MSGSKSYAGMATPFDLGGDFSQIKFAIKQLQNRNATTTLVQVVSVTTNGEVGPVGFVSVRPMVHQVDGNGQPMPHGVLHNLPYLRAQGGDAAVIMDPKVGDIGIATFASHDISSVKRTRKASLPGSRRRFSMSDGLYHGGVLNGAPQHYIRFHPNGIEIGTPFDLTITARNFAIDATGNAVMKGTVTINSADAATTINLATHHHLGVVPGGGESGQPKPGT